VARSLEFWASADYADVRDLLIGAKSSGLQRFLERRRAGGALAG
jgi:hypothetical protein